MIASVSSVAFVAVLVAVVSAAPTSPDSDLQTHFERSLSGQQLLDKRKGGIKGFVHSAVDKGKNVAKGGLNFVKNHQSEISQAAQIALPLVLAVRKDELGARSEPMDSKARNLGRNLGGLD